MQEYNLVINSENQIDDINEVYSIKLPYEIYNVLTKNDANENDNNNDLNGIGIEFLSEKCGRFLLNDRIIANFNIPNQYEDNGMNKGNVEIKELYLEDENIDTIDTMDTCDRNNTNNTHKIAKYSMLSTNINKLVLESFTTPSTTSSGITSVGNGITANNTNVKP